VYLTQGLHRHVQQRPDEVATVCAGRTRTHAESLGNARPIRVDEDVRLIDHREDRIEGGRLLQIGRDGPATAKQQVEVVNLMRPGRVGVRPVHANDVRAEVR